VPLSEGGRGKRYPDGGTPGDAANGDGANGVMDACGASGNTVEAGAGVGEAVKSVTLDGATVTVVPLTGAETVITTGMGGVAAVCSGGGGGGGAGGSTVAVAGAVSLSEYCPAFT
jgi:hypothetical protein